MPLSAVTLKPTNATVRHLLWHGRVVVEIKPEGQWISPSLLGGFLSGFSTFSIIIRASTMPRASARDSLYILGGWRVA